MQKKKVKGSVSVQLYTKSVSVQVYTKPVSVQVYTKPVYCTSVHKTSLLVNNERNVHGWNNTKVKAL